MSQSILNDAIDLGPANLLYLRPLKAFLKDHVP